MALSSPEKRCGKTTVLSILARIVYRPLPTANISPATLFRSIEKWQPTILIDEADCFLRDSDELRGILNSGHTRSTAFVLRCVGDNYEPSRFSTWGAKAIALIGNLPDTLHDRSIVVTLRRKLPREYSEKLRHTDDELFHTFRKKLARFAIDNIEIIKSARPLSIPALSDRADDNWESLQAIAGLAGAEWQEKAIKSAIALSSNGSESTTGLELLADIREILETKNIDRIVCASLIEALCNDEEKQWLTYNNGKSISPRQFAKILSEYHISNKPIKIGYDTVRGFDKVQFQDAFLRYLPPTPKSVTTLQSSTTAFSEATCELLHNKSEEQSVTKKSALSNDCNSITDLPTFLSSCSELH